MELIDLVIYAFFFFLGWIIREQLAIRRIDRFVKENEHLFEEENDTVFVTVDKLEDTFFIYEKETNAFIMQVKSREEMFESFKNNPKFFGRTILMSKDDLKIFDNV
jgi:hypothetical protein